MQRKGPRDRLCLSAPNLLLAALTLLAPAPAAADVASWPDLAEVKKLGGGKRDAALIIAAEKYAFVAQVQGARENANAWHKYLTDGRGVPAERVGLLRDRQVTVEKMTKAAEEAARKVRKGGTLWFVFIGHGAPAKDGKDGLLVGADAQQDADSLFQRSVGQSAILAALAKSPAKRIVAVVDACFSGRLPDGKPIVENLQPLILKKAGPELDRRLVLLTAAKNDEFAGPLPGLRRPAFSYLVLGGLRGWADGDGDGKITAGEVRAYAENALRAVVRDRTQTPTLEGAQSATLGNAFESGPSLASLARRFGDSEAEAPKLDGPVVPKLTDVLGGVKLGADVPVLEAYERAMETEKTGTPAQKSTVWQALASLGGQNPYRAAAAKHAAEWKDYAQKLVALEKAAGEEWEKLGRVMELKLVSLEQKQKLAEQFQERFAPLPRWAELLKGFDAARVPSTAELTRRAAAIAKARLQVTPACGATLAILKKNLPTLIQQHCAATGAVFLDMWGSSRLVEVDGFGFQLGCHTALRCNGENTTTVVPSAIYRGQTTPPLVGAALPQTRQHDVAISTFANVEAGLYPSVTKACLSAQGPQSLVCTGDKVNPAFVPQLKVAIIGDASDSILEFQCNNRCECPSGTCRATGTLLTSVPLRATAENIERLRQQGYVIGRPDAIFAEKLAISAEEVAANEELTKLSTLAASPQVAAEPKKQALAEFQTRFASLPDYVTRAKGLAVWWGEGCPEGMAAIPGGTFKMGGGGERDRSDTVTLGALCMDLTAVTAGQYKECVKAGTCSRSRATRYSPGQDELTQSDCNWDRWLRRNHPMNCVQWAHAREYCTWQKKRLPTDEEREWAARGGDEGRAYPWGNEPPTEQLCWKRSKTCAVGSYPEGKSRHGIMDLTGNVQEWTTSWRQHRRRGQEYPIFGLRGASYSTKTPYETRSATRAETPYSSEDIGFRCVKDP